VPEGLVYPVLVEAHGTSGSILLQLGKHFSLGLVFEGYILGGTSNRTGVAAPKGDETKSDEPIKVYKHECQENTMTIHIQQTERSIKVEGYVAAHHKIVPVTSMPLSSEGVLPHVVFMDHDYFISQFQRKYGKPIIESRSGPRGKLRDFYPYSTPSAFLWHPVETSFNNLPDTVTLGVAVYYDNDFSSSFPSTSPEKEIAGYVLDFFNRVVNMLKDQRNPQIKLVLTNLKLLTTDIEQLKTHSFEAKSTLEKLQAFVNSTSNRETEKTVRNAAVVFLLTKKDPVDKQERGLGGISTRGGVCDPEKNAAIISDNGLTYTGVPAATQHLIHLLGAPFDGEEGSVSCSTEDGRLLSNNVGAPPTYVLSECSKRHTRAHLRSLIGSLRECWVLEQTKLKPIHPSLPDYVAKRFDTPENICKGVLGKVEQRISYCSEHNSTCRIGCCVTNGQKTSAIYLVHAPDGYECEHGKVCMRGVCERLKTIRIFDS
ncbi:unnamed protein product, partial [Ixodes hexagonus]